MNRLLKIWNNIIRPELKFESLHNLEISFLGKHYDDIDYDIWRVSTDINGERYITDKSSLEECLLT